MPDNTDYDAANIFGVRRPLTNKEELMHRELERRSLDIIRVSNPDTKDFFAEWDKRFWRVPAGGTLDVPRYIAIKYCKDKAVETINRTNQKLHDKEIEERQVKGLPAFESKWHEEQATYAQPRYPRTNDKELLSKLYSEYWLGLVYEYGRDNPQQTSNQPEDLDMTPIELKIIKDLEGRRVDLTEQAPVKQERPMAGFDSKETLVDEVTEPEPEMYVSKKDREKNDQE